VVGVDDVAQGIRLALERGTAGRRYLLTESCWRLVDLLRLAADEFGARPPRLVLPPVPWRLLVAASRLLDRLRPLELTTPQSLRLLGIHYRADSTRARRELGWEPKPFREVLSETADWMRGAGLVE